MDLQLNGLVAVVFFLATILIFSIMTVVTLGASLYQYKFGDTSLRIAGQAVFNHFLASAAILAVDIFVFAIFTSTPKTLSVTEAKSLDWWMLYIWGPMHIFVYIVTVVVLKRVRKRKDLLKSS